MLQPGVQAPSFSLPAPNRDGWVSLCEYAGKNIALLFLPSTINEELGKQLARYQADLSAFTELNTEVISISEAKLQQLARLADALSIRFALLSDHDQATWKSYAGAEPGQSIEPTAFLLDGQGKIRAVYESTRYPNLPGPRSLARAIRQLNDGLRAVPASEQDWHFGSFDAPVTLIEYSDYQCHHCIALHQILKRIKSDYGERLLVIHRHLPLRTTHPLSEQAAEAAEAAGAQDKFWEMHDRLFLAAGALERSQLIAYAKEVGLDLERFIGDLDSNRYQQAVNQDFRMAAQSGIRFPPTLFINDILFEGPRTETCLRQRIEALLQSQNSAG